MEAPSPFVLGTRPSGQPAGWVSQPHLTRPCLGTLQIFRQLSEDLRTVASHAQCRIALRADPTAGHTSLMTMIKGNPAVAPTYLACVWLRSAKHFLSINLPNRIDERPGIL